ncbi:hypothetical protein HY797_00670, partial [Candidatus Falkowbacteria bacterium]|nr:hypothetical protein [Candidatus Falkowbacteria bacterium]
YDSKEHGPVTIRQALAGSLNIPAVKAIYLTGIENVINLAQNLGYTTLNDKDRFGLSLVLGGGAVKLLEHTNAFSAFAREGIKHPVAVILKVEDKDGKILEEFKDQNEKVLEPNIARLTNSILSDNNARAYIFGTNNMLTLGSRPVAAKTGTTNDYHDAWTIGYTPSIVTGVWVGNNNNKEMKRGADGSVVAAPIWHDYMNKVLGDTPIEYFNPPDNKPAGKPILDGIIDPDATVKIDKFSGLLANEFTPPSAIIEKQFKQAHSILYYINKDDPRGSAPSNPKSDPQFDLWENAVLSWAEKQGIVNAPIPTEYDNIHRPEFNPVVSINYPSNNQTITDQLLNVQISATSPRGVNRAEYYIDGYLFSVSAAYPFGLSKSISSLSNGLHNLIVRACDGVDNCSEQKIEFSLTKNSKPEITKIGVALTQPAIAASIIKYDFPILLKAEVINSEQVAGVTFYFKNAGGQAQKIAQSQVINNAAEALMENILAPGSYKFYAEARGWYGQLATSEEISVIVNDLPAAASTTPVRAR